MSIFEYDQEKHEETLRREGYEDGMEESAVQMLKDNLPIAKIVLYTSLPESRVIELQRNLSGE